MRIGVWFGLASIVASTLMLKSIAANADDRSSRPSLAHKTSTNLNLGTCSFQQYQTVDNYKRTITFYLSDLLGANNVPLVVYVQGSGGGSLFAKDKDTVGTNLDLPSYLAPMKGRARLLLVEKPGVKLFEQPKTWGTAEGCSTEFLRENTLERWTEAINASIKAAQSLPGIPKNRLLVIGHSEGGQVAPHVAFRNPGVTHVASLAGAGPTQLFDMTYFAEKASNGPEPDSSEKAITSTDRVEDVYRAWADMKADPHSITKFWAGHPYNRWYSYCTSSPLEDLLHCKAKIYIVQGTDDVSTSVVSFDVVRAELVAHNRNVVAERLEGADHGFRIKGKDGVIREMPAVVARIIDWYLVKPR
jgi:pimeloyl-ACP methyl ester carboxylesterase